MSVAHCGRLGGAPGPRRTTHYPPGETEGREYVDGPLRELIADLELTPGETDVVPVWSFARP